MYNFDPQIMAFVCNWCSYAGADQAGGQKLEYPGPGAVQVDHRYPHRHGHEELVEIEGRPYPVGGQEHGGGQGEL